MIISDFLKKYEDKTKFKIVLWGMTYYIHDINTNKIIDTYRVNKEVIF